ncbi:hypothetical protein EVAR_57351_1 [Eumeta japonica]|uniref:Uncharacterized protein n=1 Tax=Eumeta variegata TaxID=151549 RepID=A0A4C1ZBS5_EUMVA|nr:hypothetical protein EVAR_57351_1 [Eumeta japonica]
MWPAAPSANCLVILKVTAGKKSRPVVLAAKLVTETTSARRLIPDVPPVLKYTKREQKRIEPMQEIVLLESMLSSGVPRRPTMVIEYNYTTCGWDS